jgi:hypothetical protein
MEFIKSCPECGKQVRGRSDKKYCSDLCRNSFHNKERLSGGRTVREVNRILSRNRSILISCTLRNRDSISENYLKARGFNFNFFTHQIEDSSGNAAIFCYEVGYTKKRKNELFLVKEDAEYVYRKDV